MGTFSATLQQVIDLETGMTPYVALGLDQYVIFDETYREPLNEKIIAHYNEQEIGHETISMFRYAMKRKMNEIMPLMNQHYKASQIQIDPLLTVNIKNVGAGTATTAGTENSTTGSTSTADGRVVASQTPQVRLAGNADYATSAQDSTSKSTADGTAATTNNVDNSTTNDTTTTGYSGSPAELIFAMRAAFVNVDMMVIDQLSELFMMVWDSGEEYTKGLGYDFSSYGLFSLYR